MINNHGNNGGGNPNHDENGRFTSKENNHTGGSVEGVLSKLGFVPDKIEKPEFNDDFYRNSFKDGYKIKGNEARLGKGRLNYLIEEYGVWNDNLDYSQAYLGFIDPRQFIDGTLTENDTITRKEIDNPVDLDLDRINKERQTPFLQVDFDNNRIVGHEGRHRLSSFVKAGINRIPVVFQDRSPSFEKYKAKVKNFNGVLRGQDFGSNKASDINLVSTLIPINYKNIEQLYKMFG